MKKKVKIKFQNGLTFESGISEILNDLTSEFEFVDSCTPDFIVFGPYGNDIPKKGSYSRIGYYCENIKPDLDICEWAFGIPRETEINNPRYKRIQWHGLDPKLLIKNINSEVVFKEKQKFCNFLYSNPIFYREEFFRQLSTYKPIDAPGKSMNNVPAIDLFSADNRWEVKRRFLNPYKFTIAFESYSYPGYQTEKLYDAMRANSIPIYCGDPYIGEIFNKKSFINAGDYLPDRAHLLKFIEEYAQYDFKDYRPGTFNSLRFKVRRKLKTIAKAQKMKFQLNRLNFAPLIDKIVELDKSKEKYIEMLSEPWFNDNVPSPIFSSADRWREIFNSKLTQ